MAHTVSSYVKLLKIVRYNNAILYYFECDNKSYYTDLFLRIKDIKLDLTEIVSISDTIYFKICDKLSHNIFLLQTFTNAIVDLKIDIIAYKNTKIIQYCGFIYLIHQKKLIKCEMNSPNDIKFNELEKIHISKTKYNKILSTSYVISTLFYQTVKNQNIKLVPDNYVEYYLTKVDENLMLRYDVYKNDKIYSCFFVKCLTNEIFYLKEELRNNIYPAAIKDMIVSIDIQSYASIQNKLKLPYLDHFNKSLNAPGINHYT